MLRRHRRARPGRRGHGLTLLPQSAVTAVPGAVAEPRVVHRMELVLGGTPRGVTAALVDVLVERV